MKKAFRRFCSLGVALLAVILVIGIFGPVKIRAAEKKTVRVLTAKELNKALKKSDVGTVILRTESYDDITISTKKGKKKTLVVDCPNAKVINKSKFKSIELVNAAKYIENVSGNTITAQITAGFEVAAGKSVKKLIVTFEGADFTIRKGAAIKTLSYNFGDNKSTFDKKTRVLTFTGYMYNGYGGYDVSEQKLTLDKDGRVLSVQYKGMEGENCLTTAEYDENGNVIKTVEKNADTGEVTRTVTKEYDKNNNLIAYNDNYGGYDQYYNYEYDSKNRMTKASGDYGDGGFKRTFSYDSKGRNIECVSTYGSGGDEYGYNDYYTYNKKGYLITSSYVYEGTMKSETTYTYDKNGNITYITTVEEYYNQNSDGAAQTYTYKYEYKYEFDEFGGIIGAFMKNPENGQWVDMSEVSD